MSYKSNNLLYIHKVKVFLNIYDLTEWNQYGFQFGFGAFHTGVEIYGKGILLNYFNKYIYFLK